ncbi:MAG: hypothetical protein RLZZ347_196 [Candidatus Parcubacteria bacterium]
MNSNSNSDSSLGFKLLVFLGVVIVVGVLGVGAWRMWWVTDVDVHELGFNYNRITGQIETIDRPGWYTRTPVINSVHTIDLRPHQVTISANSRILNAKLVRFNPEGLRTFIDWHGRDAGDLTSGMLEILKSYAFDRDEGRDCPFLTVVSVLQPNQGQLPTQPVQPIRVQVATPNQPATHPQPQGKK